MRYRDENSNLRSHSTTLRWFAGFCVLAIIGLWVGWQQAKESLRIYIPSDLRSGAVLLPALLGNQSRRRAACPYIRLRQRLRLDCLSVANGNLNRLLDKPDPSPDVDYI